MSKSLGVDRRFHHPACYHKLVTSLKRSRPSFKSFKVHGTPSSTILTLCAGHTLPDMHGRSILPAWQLPEMITTAFATHRQGRRLCIV